MKVVNVQRRESVAPKRLLIAGIVGICLAALSCSNPSGSSPAPTPEETSTGYVGAGVARSELTDSPSLTVETDGTVLEKLHISGYVVVKAKNVTIRKCFIETTGIRPVFVESNASLTIEYTELQGSTGTDECINQRDATGSFTGRYLNVHGSVDGLKMGANSKVENSYIHDLAVYSGTHNDGIQIMAGSNISIQNNYIKMGNNYNAAIIIQTDFGAIDNVQIIGNYLTGGGYTIFSRIGNYGGAPTGVAIRNNRFGRDYKFGLLSKDGTVTWDGNTWYDTGAAANY